MYKVATPFQEGLALGCQTGGGLVVDRHLVGWGSCTHSQPYCFVTGPYLVGWGNCIHSQAYCFIIGPFMRDQVEGSHF
jgi:hypothetical protein